MTSTYLGLVAIDGEWRHVLVFSVGVADQLSEEALQDEDDFFKLLERH